MAAQSGTPGAPAQYSADGKWWWDGSGWVPVTDAGVSQEESAGAHVVGAVEEVWGLISHYSIIAAPILGPVILMWTVGKRYPFVRSHSAEALNFQLTYVLVLAVWSVLPTTLPSLLAPTQLLIPGLVLFFALSFALIVARLVLPIRAGARAYRGQLYRYPLTIRLVRPKLPPIEFVRRTLPPVRPATEGYAAWMYQLEEDLTRPNDDER